MTPRRTQKDPKEELKKFLKSEEFDKYAKILERIDITEIEDPFAEDNKPKLKTNTVLDDLLGYGKGISAGKLIELYGGYGSGKTQTVFTLVAEASQEGTVLLVDTERTFSKDRLLQICTARGLDTQKLKDNLILWRPKDYMEQLAMIVNRLPSAYDLEQRGKPPIKLVAVDSLVCLVDDSRDFRGRQNLPARAGVIRDMLRALRDFATENDCAVVFTNQVSSVPDVTKFTKAYQKEQGVGGNVVRHKPDVILYYRRTTDPYRIVRLMDSSELPVAERVFQIDEKGVSDVGTYKGWMKKFEADEESTVDDVEGEVIDEEAEEDV